jgi:hypothetical protein
MRKVALEDGLDIAALGHLREADLGPVLGIALGGRVAGTGIVREREAERGTGVGHGETSPLHREDTTGIEGTQW